MFDAVRNHQRVLQIVLLLLILPSFVFFGLSGYERFLGDDDRVASVGDFRISRPELDAAVREQANRLRDSLGPNADLKQFDTPAMRARVLEDLIDQRSLDGYAQRNYLNVSDGKLRERIASQTGLQKPDGSFDLDRYRALLAAQGRSEASFEAEVRQGLRRGAVPEALAESALMPKRVAERALRGLQQTREFSVMSFVPDRYRSQLKPSDEQLAQFHQEHAEQFTLPQTAKVAWVVLNAEALAGQVNLAEDDLRTYYQQNQQQFGRPERRRASHILIRLAPNASEAELTQAQAKANALIGQLQAAAGDRFAEIARKESDDTGSKANGGDLDWFNRDAMVKPFADAVFNASGQGLVAQPVRSEFGLHVIRVTGIEAPVIPAFDQVRAQIESTVRKQQADKRFAESAEAFSNLVYEQSDSLEPAATKFGLRVHTLDGLTPNGPASPGAAAALGADAQAVFKNPRLLAALFTEESTRTRRNTEAIEIAPGSLASAKVVESRPAQRQPLEAVREQVKALWTQQQARQLALAAGTARLAELKSAEPAKAASTADPSSPTFGAPLKLSRVERAAAPPAVANAILSAPIDKLPAYVGIDLQDQGYAIARITAVSDAAGADTPKPDADKKGPKLEQLRAELLRAESEQATLAWLKSWQAKLGIERSLK